MRDNLDQLVDLALPAELQAVVAILADPSRPVRVIGGRYSQTVARHLVVLLEGVRPNVSYISGQAQSWAPRILDLTRKSVLIVFDTRRYQGDLQEAARLAADRGVEVVLFTDPWNRQYAGIASHVLAAPVRAPSVFDSFVAQLVLVEALVAATADALGDRAKRRLADLEHLRMPTGAG
jgi:DNA-binding MurR/RpiR family transcriptional regulator